MLSAVDKKKAYSQEMDFNVDRNTVDRPKTQMYSHLGTIFYNYFNLKNSTADFLNYISGCVNCTNADVVNWMTSKSGLSKDQLLYPN